MKLLHTLATKTNEIQLGTPDFATLHRRRGTEITHAGFLIEAQYAGPNEKQAKHKYGLVFDVDEARAFYDALGQLLSRFDGPDLPEHHLEEEIGDIEED